MARTTCRGFRIRRVQDPSSDYRYRNRPPDGQSYRVEAAAASALTKTRSDKAFDGLVSALAIESHNNLVRQSVLSALAEVGPIERVRPIILGWTAYGKISGTDQGQFRSSETGRHGHNTITAIIELLNDPWIFTRESAIGALGELRAEEALDELEVSANTEFDGRLRKEPATQWLNSVG